MLRLGKKIMCCILLALFAFTYTTPVVNAVQKLLPMQQVNYSDEKFTKEVEVIVNSAKSAIEEKREVEIEIEPIVEPELESEPKSEPIYVFNISSEEREMLAQLLYLEAGSCNWDTQAAVCSVIFNRLISGHWGSTLYEVVYAQNQFEPAYLIGTITPQSTQYEIIDYICQYGTTLPYYVLYFRADYYHNFGIPYTNYENVYFSYSERDI